MTDQPTASYASSRDEVPFSFDELFFSRTDERGIVESGNGVFQRISLYGWEELLKKPHNIIRHPDMPKGVFYLFWETLKKGEPIGAYVKNRAKDGRYYWVFAVATPVEGGYLSVRLKPSTSVFSLVEQEYKALVALERETKISPKESAAKLLERLKELGFNNYQEFMAAALGKEMAARNTKLSREEDGALTMFEQLMEKATSILKQADGIFYAYGKNEYVPLNLQVQSARLGDSGATIGVISNNYNIISTEIKNIMNQFMETATQVFATIHGGQFLMCTAKLQQEVVEFFRTEEANEYVNKEQEMHLLESQQKGYMQKALDGMRNIVATAGQFQQDCQDMKRLSSGLEVTRVMGKVESARLPEYNDGLNELIDDLETFQTTISTSLREIEQVSRHIKQGMETMLKAAGAR